MARIKLANAARADLHSLCDFLAQFDLEVADRGNAAILAGLEYIEHHPNSGALPDDRPGVRKSVVAFGASG